VAFKRRLKRCDALHSRSSESGLDISPVKHDLVEDAHKFGSAFCRYFINCSGRVGRSGVQPTPGSSYPGDAA